MADGSANYLQPIDGATIAAIEASLRSHARVRQVQGLVRSADGSAAMTDCIVSWKVELNSQMGDASGVDCLLVGIDRHFPWSQPIVRAPPSVDRMVIPHIESSGNFCLRRTASSLAPGARVISRLEDALFILSQDRQWCDDEFRREFISYWIRHLPDRKYEQVVVSLLDPFSRSGVVATHESTSCLYVASDEATLRHWLANFGVEDANVKLGEAWFEPLAVPWTPRQFPVSGRDVLSNLSTAGTRFLRERPSGNQLVVYGTETTSGPAMVAVQLDRPKFRSQPSGMSKPRQMHPLISAITLEEQKVTRLRCERADIDWVYGRDHGEHVGRLRPKRVAVIGLGALGGYVARLLAQAGIGSFVLVDHDLLSEHNTSRHVLGARSVGLHKVEAVARLLKQDFPHIRAVTPYQKKFERLNEEELNDIGTCDLVISAGVTYEADILMDRWRTTLANAPPHLCVWTEEFALVGHAVALLGRSSIRDAFDETDRVRFRLTQWPPTAVTMIQQAGCGDSFQPHGAIGLQSTVQLAAALALDVLVGNATHSIRRVWCGDRAEVVRRGGAPSDQFVASNSITEYNWN